MLLYDVIPLLGVLLVSVAAFLILRRFRLLSTSGAVAAVLLAVVLLGLGGLEAFIPVLVFFLSSSMLSRIADGIAPDADGRFAKGSERDALQVAANGGVAAIAEVCMAAGGGERWYAALLGWKLGEEGRKLYSGTALYTESGRLCALATCTWIVLKD